MVKLCIYAYKSNMSYSSISDLLLVTKEMKILKPLENFEGYKYLLDSYPALTSASNETKVRFQMV